MGWGGGMSASKFKIIYLIIPFLFSQTLFAQNSFDHDFDNLEIIITDEITKLVNNIYDLFEAGYSINEIVIKLDDGLNHSYDLHKLVRNIYELFKKQNLNNYLIKIDKNKDNSKNISLYKKIESKIKNFYKRLLALKIAAYSLVLVIVLILCFLIYKYGRLLSDLIIRLLAWLLHFFKPPNEEGEGPENNELPPPNISAQLQEQPKQNIEVTAIEVHKQELANAEIIQPKHVALTNQEESPTINQSVSESNKASIASNVDKSQQVSAMPLIPPRVQQSSFIDFVLNKELEQQTLLVKDLEFNISAIDFEATKPSEEQIKNFHIPINEQIAYAMGIGLVL